MDEKMSPRTRRIKPWTFAAALSMIAALVIWVPAAQAQRGAYPSGPVRVIVGFPPGGGVDVVAVAGPLGSATFVAGSESVN